MIPTYNCAHLLQQTLESVLAQAPSESEMQIEVIDDCSTKDDPEQVVREIGQGRVSFFRQPQNVGATRNFNTCLQRSRGRWVHILHGDDYVLPGFYKAVQDRITQFPEAGMVCTRSFIVDEEGEIVSLSPRAKSLEHFSKDAAPYTVSNFFFFPSVVLNREFVEQFGGFDTHLNHVADWEMWVRAIHNRGGAAMNQPLACYRTFEHNDTSRLMRTADNLRDYTRLRTIFAATIDGFPLHDFQYHLRKTSKDQILFFQRRGDHEAVRLNRQFRRELLSMREVTRILLRKIFR